MSDRALEPTPARGRPPLLPSAARWGVGSINSLVHFGLMLLVRPVSRHTAWRVYRNWVRIAYRIFGITCSLRDDNSGDRGPPPHLYVLLNQSSLAESLAYPHLLPKLSMIINVEYAAIPLLGWARLLLDDIVIVRQWKRQAKRGIERAAQRLAAGEAWGISIEGARSPDGTLLPYKKGPVVMALQSQATIIPMMFHGGRDIMPRGEWRLRPGHFTLHLLRAIPTRGLTYDDRHDVLESLRSMAEVELRGRVCPPGTAVGSLE